MNSYTRVGENLPEASEGWTMHFIERESRYWLAAKAGKKQTKLFEQGTQRAWNWAKSAQFIRWFTDGEQRYGKALNVLNFKNCFKFKVKTNSMNTLDQVLETALQLPYEQQEMLIKILQNRHHESRRAKIAADAQQSLADFHAGNFRPQSPENVITALRKSLNDSET